MKTSLNGVQSHYGLNIAIHSGNQMNVGDFLRFGKTCVWKKGKFMKQFEQAVN